MHRNIKKKILSLLKSVFSHVSVRKCIYLMLFFGTVVVFLRLENILKKNLCKTFQARKLILNLFLLVIFSSL